jgi:hypothetical protein
MNIKTVCLFEFGLKFGTDDQQISLKKPLKAEKTTRQPTKSRLLGHHPHLHQHLSDMH